VTELKLKSKLKLRRSGTLMGLFSLCIIFVLASTSSFASDSVKKLKEFRKNVASFKAEFNQVLKDDNNAVLQSASGSMSFKRPGKFRWDYVKPDKQQIVSNGRKIWIYDEELEQVTIKSLKKGLGKTPARVLTESADLDKEFDIKDLGKKEGIDWVELKPKGTGNEFQSIKIGFDKSLRKMILSDNLKQTTTIDFTKLTVNPKISASEFNFKIPKGVDVIGGDSKK